MVQKLEEQKQGKFINQSFTRQDNITRNAYETDHECIHSATSVFFSNGKWGIYVCACV